MSSRRSFLRLAATSLGVAAVEGYVRASERMLWARTLLGGEAKVKGAKAIPPFIPFNIPQDAGVKFLVIGDWGTGGSGQRGVAKAMVRTASDHGCDAVISTGDNIYPKGVTSVDDPQWERKFTGMYAAQGLTQPFYPTLGNHDYSFDPDAQIAYSRKNPQWKFPSRTYTSLLTGGDGTTVQLFSLDTQLVQTKAEGAAERQRAWLDAELERSTARWKIVFGHHMLYSNGIYGNLGRIRNTFEDVLTKHKVAIYLCGHDHDIQLLKPVNGVNYVVSGGGGGERDTSWGENTIYAATNKGYVWMAATGEGLYLHFHDAEGTIKFARKVA